MNNNWFNSSNHFLLFAGLSKLISTSLTNTTPVWGWNKFCWLSEMANTVHVFHVFIKLALVHCFNQLVRSGGRIIYSILFQQNCVVTLLHILQILLGPLILQSYIYHAITCITRSHISCQKSILHFLPILHILLRPLIFSNKLSQHSYINYMSYI